VRLHRAPSLIDSQRFQEEAGEEREEEKVVVYPLTFLISATRSLSARAIRGYGATLRRFELRGAPRKHGLTPGIAQRERTRGNGERQETRGGSSEGKNRQEGTGIERVRGPQRRLFFTCRVYSYTRRMRTPRSPISGDSINMAPLNNARWIRPVCLESLVG